MSVQVIPGDCKIFNCMRNKLLFLPFFLLLVPGPSMARESIPRDTVGVKVYFRQNHASLDSLFRDNGSRLDSFSRRLSSFRGDTALQIRSVRVVSGASPEGSSEINRSLSERRSAAIRSYLEKRGSLEGYAFDVESRGVNWEELAALVESSDMPNRDEVLEILYHTPEFVIREGEVVDSRQRQLGMLHGGQPWHYMEERFFPELRASGVHVVFETGEMEASSPEPVVPSCDTVVAEHRDTVEVVRRDTVVVPGPVVPSRKPFYMALKTNLLYDVTLVPNIGAEFYLGRGWSLGGNWMYAWWNSNKRHNYWRLYGGELEIRKYFGRHAAEKPLTGHHLELYGQLFTYDFELGGTGYMGGKPGGSLWEKCNYAVGVEYGYSLPVGRRLNLDFVIGVGYWGGEYHTYDPVDDHHVRKETRQRHWFGPTKAEISLVWLIGRGNYNEKKGGKR